MTMEQMTEFFKWMTLIDVAILTITSVLVMSLRKMIYAMHGKLFGLSEQMVACAIYGYVGVFKVFVIVFNIVPYLALVLMQ